MPNLKLHVGLWGTILWALLLSKGEWFLEHESLIVSQSASAYILGFIMAFAGALFTLKLNGQWEEHFSPMYGCDRLLMIICLSVISLFGALVFTLTIIGSFPWHYNVSFFLATFVVSQGLSPMMLAKNK
jgi:hypothetical protein